MVNLFQNPIEDNITPTIETDTPNVTTAPQLEEQTTADIRKRGRFLSTESRQQLEIEKLQNRPQPPGPPIPFALALPFDQPPPPPTPEQIRAAEIVGRQEAFMMGGAVTGGLVGGVIGRNPTAVAAGGEAGALTGLAIADSITAIEDFTNFRNFFSTEDADNQLATLGEQYLDAAKTEAYYNFGGLVAFKVAAKTLKYPVTKIFGVAKNQAELTKLLTDAQKNNIKLALFNTPSKLARFYSKILGIFPIAGAGIRSRFVRQAGEVQTAADDFLDTFAPVVQVDKLGINLINRIERSVKSFRNVSSFFYSRFFDTATDAGNPRFIPTTMFKKAIETLIENPNQLPNIPAFKNAAFLKNTERRTTTIAKRSLLLEKRAQRLADKEDPNPIDLEILELDKVLRTIDDEILELKLVQGPEGLEASLRSLISEDKGQRAVSVDGVLQDYLQLGEFLTATEYRALQRELNRVARKAGKDDFLILVSTALRDGMETDLQNVARGFAPFRLSELGLEPVTARKILQSLSDANDFYVRGKTLMNSKTGKFILKADPDAFRAGFTNKIPTVSPTELSQKMVDDPTFRDIAFLNDLERLLNFGQEAAGILKKKVGAGRGPAPVVVPKSEEYFSQLTRLFLEKRMTQATSATVIDAEGRKIAFIKADTLEDILGLRELGGISASTAQQSKEFLTALFEKTGRPASVEQLRGLIDVTRAVFESPVSDPSVFAARRITLQGLRDPGNFFGSLGEVLFPTAKLGAGRNVGLQAATTVGGVKTLGFLNFGLFIVAVRAGSRIITQPVLLKTLVSGLKQSPTRQTTIALLTRLMELDPELERDGLFLNPDKLLELDLQEALDNLDPAAFVSEQVDNLQDQLNETFGPR